MGGSQEPTASTAMGQLGVATRARRGWRGRCGRSAQRPPRRRRAARRWRPRRRWNGRLIRRMTSTGDWRRSLPTVPVSWMIVQGGRSGQLLADGRRGCGPTRGRAGRRHGRCSRDARRQRPGRAGAGCPRSVSPALTTTHSSSPRWSASSADSVVARLVEVVDLDRDDALLAGLLQEPGDPEPADRELLGELGLGRVLEVVAARERRQQPPLRVVHATYLHPRASAGNPTTVGRDLSPPPAGIPASPR